MGAGKRKSIGGAKMRRGSAISNVMMSAKKRARLSEYARRKSRAVPGSTKETSESAVMDVDNQ
jgi:hypothetical protein